MFMAMVLFIKLFLAYLVLFVPVISCKTAEDKTTIYADNGRCEMAAASALSDEPYENLLQNLKKPVGVTASYGITGITAVTETSVYIAGFWAGFLICLPETILISAVAGSNGSVSGHCILSENPYNPKMKYEITSDTWEKTSTWRRKSFDDLSSSFRKVIQCYLDRGTYKDIHLAAKQFESLKKSYWDHVSEGEQDRLVELEKVVKHRKYYAEE